MTNKELETIEQLTEVAIKMAELKAENKILKDINEKLMQALRIHDVSGRSEHLVCESYYANNLSMQKECLNCGKLSTEHSQNNCR
jgi:hypothetical protein